MRKRLFVLLTAIAVACSGTACSGETNTGSESPAEPTTTAAPQTAEGTTAAETGSTESSGGGYTDGIYSAKAKGMAGDVAVTVAIEGGKIAQVVIDEHQETEGIGTMAVEQLPDAIVEAQSTEVDVIAGATITSNAILTAVEECLVQAGGEAPAAKEVQAGTYEGEGMGMKGLLKAAVTVDENGKVTDIEITEHKETPGIYEAAVEQVPQRIIDGQTLSVDSVTGATLTSAAIKMAVQDALSEAGLDKQFASAPAYKVPAAQKNDMEADVVVVGGGLAGLMTAYKASLDGASVVIVEKNGYVGGSLPRSAGMMYTLNSKAQAEAGFEVPEEGEYGPEHSFANTFMYHASGKAIDALTDMGIEYADIAPTVMTFGPEIGRSGGPVVLALTEAVKNNGVTILYETVAKELINDNGTCAGAVVETKDGQTFSVKGKATVLSTGGWSNNEELIAKYQPEAVNSLRGGNSYATGDGHEMALEAFNANFVNMEAGNLAYSITKHTYQYLTFALTCGIMVDTDGNRFMDEVLAGNDYIALDKAVLALPDQTYYMIFDSANAQFSGESELIDSLVETGAAHVYSSLEELVKTENIPGLMDSIERYNGFCQKGEDEDFGRHEGGILTPIALDDDSYYCIEGTIGYYSSLGGIDVDTSCRVLDVEGNIVPGLYAAGEVTGNVYYHDLGYYGGGLGTAYSMGWVAGEEAGAEAK